MERVGEPAKWWLYLEAQQEKQQEGVVKCLEMKLDIFKRNEKGENVQSSK